MKFRHKITLSLLLTIVLCDVAFAQEFVMPDANLQHAVRSALSLNSNQPITRINMLQLERLVAKNQHIVNLTGLEHATRLEYLVLSGNDISDLTPLTNLVKLRHLALGENQISDIRPLANLINLRELHLSNNMVTDVSPLSTMTNLRRLVLEYNLIEDFTPLTNLTNVINLGILGNPATDYGAILAMSIPHLSYDQCCEIKPLPVRGRIANRDYPSIGMPWGGDKGWMEALNRPDLTRIEQIALHDLWLAGGHFPLKVKNTGDSITIVGEVSKARQLRDEFLMLNPNMIFIKEVRIREVGLHTLPSDSPFWVRGENGEIVVRYRGYGLYDFTNPAVLDRILAEVRAIERCGLFDGIFFDHWNDGDTALAGYRPLEAEQRARAALMRFIRTELRPDFLVLVNGGSKLVGPMTGPLVNGTFIETGADFHDLPGSMASKFRRYAATLTWSESTMQTPLINLFEGAVTLSAAPDSPINKRWMRVFTTISLTHSDGYTVFTNGSGHRHAWYDFWDADLGRPVGEKGQLYQETDGLYVREFTNGWAVYNNSGEAQVITLPEEVRGVASGLAGTEHELPNLDGEMYLRAKLKNPADVNEDGVVNILDLTLVAQALGTDSLEGDVNGDGVVNVFDLVFVAEALQ